MMKIVAYYVFAKNERDIEEIDTDIIIDTYDKNFQFILDNVRENDYLYDIIKSKLLIPDFFKEYLLENIVPIIGVQIEISDEDNEEYMSFAGLGDLLTLLRNKVQSHGNISQSNIEYIEKTLETLVVYFNEFIALDEIELKNVDGIVNMRYGKEKFVSLNKYAIYRENNILLLQGASKKQGKYRYINYFNGKHNKPSEVEIDL